MKRKTATAVCAALALLALILDAKTAMDGAAQGIELCIKVVIPSLFPLFVVTMLFCSAIRDTSWGPLRWIGSKCGIPKGAQDLLVPAFLGGYPAGAQAVAQAHTDGRITKECAGRLLSFCNNAGPAFIFGMAAVHFSQGWAGWGLWATHILSALFVGLLDKDPGITAGRAKAVPEISIQTALLRTIRVMATICGWVVLFRVILRFADRWFIFLLPDEISVVLAGLLELSNGCCSLGMVKNSGLRFVVAAGMLSFGGICVAMQTASVTGELGIREYVKGKLLQTLISISLALMAQRVLFAPDERLAVPTVVMLIGPVAVIFIVFLYWLRRKNSRFPAVYGV